MSKIAFDTSKLPAKELEAVLEYLWHSELDYYLECPLDEKQRSVFSHALTVAAWLNECDGRSNLYGRMVASLRRVA